MCFRASYNCGQIFLERVLLNCVAANVRSVFVAGLRRSLVCVRGRRKGQQDDARVYITGLKDGILTSDKICFCRASVFIGTASVRRLYEKTRQTSS